MIANPTSATGIAFRVLVEGLAMRACQAPHRVLFATATEWVARLAEAHHGLLGLLARLIARGALAEDPQPGADER